MTLLLIVIITPLVAITSYMVGKYNERVAWNQLIKEGKLPTPSESKKFR